MTRIDGFIRKLESATTLNRLKSVLRVELAVRSFGAFAYLSLHRNDEAECVPFVITTFPQVWIDRYISDYLDIDPVLKRARNAKLPFTWGGREEVGTLEPKARLLYSEAAQFGIRRGLAVPVFGNGGEFALLSAASDLSDAQFAGFVGEIRHEMHLITLYFHHRVGEFIADSRPRDGVLNLTPRELECLRWTSQGKTSWETARILNISEHTLNFHMRSAMRKLGTYSKHHAVIKAIMLGFLKV